MIAHALITHLLCPYASPATVLPRDNGKELKTEVLKSICSQYITQTFIIAYNPVCNGLVERTNRKILEIFRHGAGQLHESWQDWLPHVAA